MCGGFLRFSITTAYVHRQELDDLIKSKFPSFEFFWRSSDDCGNFYEVFDPLDEAGFNRFYLDDGREPKWYTLSEKQDFLRDLAGICPGIEVPDDITEDCRSFEAFAEKFYKWRNSGGEDRKLLDFLVFLPAV